MGVEMQLPATTALRLGYPLFPLFHQVNEPNAECLTDGAQFHQVKSSLAGLVLAHEGLRAFELLGKFDLRDVGVGSRLTEKFDQVEVFRRVDRPLHPDNS